MRLFRPAALLLLALPAAASAQSSMSTSSMRGFENSLFLGALAGNMTFSTTRIRNAHAPMYGVDMLATRSRVGLYASYNEARFDEQSEVRNSPADLTGLRRVDLHNLRRGNLMLIGFPRSFRQLRPYLGAGLSVNIISRTEPVGTFESTANRDTVSARVEAARSRAGVGGIAGLQGNFRRVAIFGQGTFLPKTRQNFFNNGETYTLEVGVRFNTGPSRMPL